ncbi:MAG: epoxyqueuosine reductase [Desulfobacteraceae bacterium]|nr:MAG: epoxyqueuosine reductase [Desulfobacteraceae bacterium]
MGSEYSGNLLAWVEDVTREFLRDPRRNTLGTQSGEKAFEESLVGFSNGADTLFQSLKDHVGPFHWTPQEIFQQTFPQRSIDPGKLTVISWVLPHTLSTKSDNRKERAYPSERWARARVCGEEVNNALRRHVVERLASRGIDAVAPLLVHQWELKISEKYGFASTWSERHVAYISGLGTFGLCDGLITSKGKAMRLGSVVANFESPSTIRPYNDHHAYCLYYSHGLCGECIRRCPAGAISKRGHDKTRCREYTRSKVLDYIKTRFGFEGYACGLCQTGIPCESKIPGVEDLK